MKVGSKVTTINVATDAERQQAIVTYVSKGFITSAQTADMTTLNKKGGIQNLISNPKNIILVFLGILLCVFPGVIYAWVCIGKGDEVVIIRVDPVAAAADAKARASETAPEQLQWSEDRRYWWNGESWVDAASAAPSNARYSEDRQQWWDGQDWRPVPNGSDAPKEVEGTAEGA
jgi:hypothetical protein